MSRKIEILRLDHRHYRDQRITSHVVLSSRAFGATSFVYSGERDENLEPSMSDVIKRWGGDFTIDSYQLADVGDRAVRNIVHASGSPEEAEEEVKLWFDSKELNEYRLTQEVILYDVNMDGILE